MIRITKQSVGGYGKAARVSLALVGREWHVVNE